jgi:hypothetical protein
VKFIDGNLEIEIPTLAPARIGHPVALHDHLQIATGLNPA